MPRRSRQYSVSNREWVAHLGVYVKSLISGQTVMFATPKMRDRWLHARYGTPIADKLYGNSKSKHNFAAGQISKTTKCTKAEKASLAKLIREDGEA